MSPVRTWHAALAVAVVASPVVLVQGIGAGPGATPSKERSVPAETTMAAANIYGKPAEGAEIFNADAGE